MIYHPARPIHALLSASIAATALVAATADAMAKAAEKDVAIPFVACASDGQVGPVATPASSGETPRLWPEAAAKLAYYASSALGVIAPRGWQCFGIDGSGGAILFVTPERHDAADLFRPDSKMRGPAIQLTRILGSTSGRFEVARLAARLFPVAGNFVRSVIDEGIEPATNFPFRPYPEDHLTRRGPTIVEYLSPADTEGLGTDSRLAKNGQPVSGAVILLPEEDMDLVKLDVRLPAELRDFAPRIIDDILTTKGAPKVRGGL